MINKIYRKEITNFVDEPDRRLRSIIYHFWLTSIYNYSDDYLFELQINSLKEEFNINFRDRHHNDEYEIALHDGNNNIFSTEIDNDKYQIIIQPNNNLAYLFGESDVNIISNYQSYDIDTNYSKLTFYINGLRNIDISRKGFIIDIICSYLKTYITNVEMVYHHDEN